MEEFCKIFQNSQKLGMIELLCLYIESNYKIIEHKERFRTEVLKLGGLTQPQKLAHEVRIVKDHIREQHPIPQPMWDNL